MHTKETIDLQLYKIPQRARCGFRFKNLMHNLVVVAELCNAGCKVIFDKNDVVVQKEGEQVVHGWRDRPTRLWHIPIVDKQIQPPEIPLISKPNTQHANAAVAINSADYTMHLANSVYDCNTQKELLQFYHATMFSPDKNAVGSSTMGLPPRVVRSDTGRYEKTNRHRGCNSKRTLQRSEA
eukprot:1450137-Ditylum_brightwellii.AAC.1